jgi:hypothetical protein
MLTLSGFSVGLGFSFQSVCILQGICQLRALDAIPLLHYSLVPFNLFSSSLIIFSLFQTFVLYFRICLFNFCSEVEITDLC